MSVTQTNQPGTAPCCSYDPNNLHPLDEQARQYDDNSDGIDWDEIIASTEDDYRAGRFAFNSADYPDAETAKKALDAFFNGILQEVLSSGDRTLSRVASAR